MVFDGKHSGNKSSAKGFTLVEAIVAVSLVGIGLATSYTALTKANAFASTARNYTGAYTVVATQIDLLLSDSPFNPQKTNEQDGSPQIPPELVVGTQTKIDLPIYAESVPFVASTTNGSTTVTSANAAFTSDDVNKVISGNGVPVGATVVSVTNASTIVISAAATADSTTASLSIAGRGVLVYGAMTTDVVDVSPTPNAPPYIYRATVTVRWPTVKGTSNYLDPNRKYSFSMGTMRASDI